MAEKKVVKKTAKPASVKTTAAKEKAPKSSGADFAVIETGGKQYGVTSGQTIKIEKMLAKNNESMKVGDSVSFDKVLLVDGADVQVGAPYISGSKVSGTISEIGRDKKVTVIKYKQKSRYLKRNGHRQPFFKVKITSIK